MANHTGLNAWQSGTASLAVTIEQIVRLVWWLIWAISSFRYLSATKRRRHNEKTECRNEITKAPLYKYYILYGMTW